MQKSKFILVYSTLKQDEIALIKSLLDAVKIQYYVSNESPGFTVVDGQLMDIMVVESKADDAKELLKDIINPSKKKE